MAGLYGAILVVLGVPFLTFMGLAAKYRNDPGDAESIHPQEARIHLSKFRRYTLLATFFMVVFFAFLAFTYPTLQHYHP